MLHPTTRQATFTEDGLAILPLAKQAVFAAEVARAMLAREQAVPRGMLRVAAPASIVRIQVVSSLPGLLSDIPISASIRASPSSSRHLLIAVLRDQISFT
jgi:DNA-binding transcriptional LysR family regulator